MVPSRHRNATTFSGRAPGPDPPTARFHSGGLLASSHPMKLPLALASLAFMAAIPASRADEGMWLFNAPPRAQLKARYGFDLTDPWLDHLMKSSVRFDSGGSGSFVSADGLVITNHHIGLDSLQKLSSARKNYVKDGFLAATPADEVRVVDEEIDALQSIEDVTSRVNAGVPASAGGGAAAKARRSVIAAIEKESTDKTGLRSEVVTLYQGGAYHLYRYKRYTDIRLVFAPDDQAGSYGGDPDNFEYPRYDLDICIFRVYENGKPLHPAHYLAWSATGPKDGDLVFSCGNPGSSEREDTVAELRFLRDVRFPVLMEELKRREVLLLAWGARSLQNAARCKDDLLDYQNSRKVRDGHVDTLMDPAFMASREAAEQALKRRFASDPRCGAALAAYQRIANAKAEASRHYLRYRLLELGWGFDSDLFGIARKLLRAGAERPKANGLRLKEYGDANREALELELFSAKPIYTDYEILKLGDSLASLGERLGGDDALVKRVLAGRSPRARASELVRSTRVGDIAERRRLYSGGAAAVDAARDPMIELARVVDAEARGLRIRMETADEIGRQAHAAIEKARFELDGASVPPDATFTPRLSFGAVRGYQEDGQPVAPFTTVAGLYERASAHAYREPFDLTQPWLQSRARLNPATPFNFVCTLDTIGGSSGSPTVGRDGAFVGIVFDGNIQSLSGDFAYDEVQSRTICVDSAIILEAMRTVYGAGALADELATGHRQ
jgi:Peptidase S46